MTAPPRLSLRARLWLMRVLASHWRPLAARDGGAVSQADFARLRRAGWKVSPVVEARLRLNGRNLDLSGVEPVTLPAQAGLALSPDGQGDEGGGDAQGYAAFALPPGLALIAPATLRELGLEEGDRPEINGVRAPPLAVSSAAAPGTLVMDIGFAQRLAGMEGAVSRLLVSPEPAPHARPLEEVAPHLRREAGSPRADLGQLTESFHLNLTAFGGLAFVVGLFITHGAVGLAFEQRRPLFRTLRACGVSARALTLALLSEMLTLALIAGLAGVVCGYLVAGALLPDVAASLRGLYGARVPGSLALSPWWWAAGLAMSLLGAAVAAGAAIARAARLPVLEAARPEAWRAAQARALRRQTVAALACAAAAGLLAAFGDGLIAGFALMAALLGAAALGLPPILARALTRLARAARRPLPLWAFADARQQLAGLSLALMALLMALAVNIGVGTMVDGFRLTFNDWLQSRLAADLYVRAAPGADAPLRDWLAAREGVTALEEAEIETPVSGWPTEIQGFQDAPFYRANWPLLEAQPGAWDRIAAGEAAMVSEQLARRLGLWLGDRLSLPTPSGEWRLAIAAIHADYGNAKGQVRVSLPALAERWPDLPRGRFAVLTDRPREVLSALRAPGGPEIDRAIAQAGLQRISRSIFERTFAVTAALNALTLAVAGIALLTSLATLAASRLPQVAPLWALGVTRARLAWLELGKTLGLALMTAILAIPLGVALAWALVAVVNVEAFGWRLPLHLFPGQWARLALLALAASALAAAIPLLRLARTPPARLAKVFADER
jgi:putative ABC transport system permease protein